MQLPNIKNFQGEIEGKKIDLYALKNSKEMTLFISNFGATCTHLFVPDREGKPTDVLLGFDDLAGVIKGSKAFIGSSIGRYANRIAEGQFVLDGKKYQLELNNGKNHLHGGSQGFHQCIWKVEEYTNNHLVMSYFSKDGEAGYPGNLFVKAIFSITENNLCKIQYEASTDKKTLCNLTNHAYFNLNGVQQTSTVLNHNLQLFAKEYTPIDKNQIPLGIQDWVADTPFDFRKTKEIGKDIHQAHKQLLFGSGGYDHNFVLQALNEDLPKSAAIICAASTGIQLEIQTTKPGIQFYTGNSLNGALKGKYNVCYEKYAGFCIEPQYFPDSPNQDDFPSAVLEAEKVYQSKTVYKFSTF